jgi:hypothetical protein
VTAARRELLADWLTLLGASVLFASLFLTWSHQFSPSFLAAWGNSAALRGVPHDPTAWQVYGIVDLLLALLAVVLVLLALIGRRAARAIAFFACVLALVFIVHALGHPPTNGTNIFDPARRAYVSNSPSSGGGEIVAIGALALAIGGLGLSFTAD